MDKKPIPKTIAVFGATGHMGEPLARFIRFKSPETKLRLITSNAARQQGLIQKFPETEVVIANYLDAPSMDKALAGMEGIFMITPPYMNEEKAVGNLISAVKKSNTIIQIVRILGYEPESNPARVPKELREFGSGTATQHYVAKRLLDESELPVTYLNCGASFMDNLLACAETLRRDKKFIWASRWMAYVDPREVGEAAARLLLSDDARHLYQFHTINNGQDLMWTSQVVEIMSDVFQVKIVHEGSREAFLAEWDPLLERRYGRKGFAEYRWNFFSYEQKNAIVWALNDFGERMLGRKLTTLRAWLQEHRKVFFPDAP